MSLVNYDDRFDLPPIDYDQSKVPQNIKERADGVREAVFGTQNKEFIAQAVEMAGLTAREAEQIAENNRLRQDSLEVQTAQSVAQMEADKDAVIANATVDSEVILARGDKPTLQARLDETTAQLAQTDTKIVTITPEMFGAVGGGIVDDTDSFREMATYIRNNVLNDRKYFHTEKVFKLDLKSETYKLKGTDVFFVEGDDLPPFTLIVNGNGSSFIWEVENESDKLFHINNQISTLRIYNLNIYTNTRSSSSFIVGGDVFYFNSSAGNDTNTKNIFDGVRVTIAYPSGGAPVDMKSVRPSRVFSNHSKVMNDQSLVVNCVFSYFKTLYYSDNPEAVNWTFSSSGFFAGGYQESVYFEFKTLGDNFNVENCSFSLYENETLLKTRSGMINGKATAMGDFNFNFYNNRFEIYGNLGGVVKISDMDFGRLNLKNSNFRLGAGSDKVKSVFSGYGLANFNFENVTFNEVEFRTPIITTEYLTGASSTFGLYMRKCDFIRGKIVMNYFDGSNTYSIQEGLITYGYMVNHIKVTDCTYSNGSDIINYAIVPARASNSNRQISDITVSDINGVAFGREIVLPPYQTINSIKVSHGPLPETYTKYRIYFGAKNLNNFIDVDLNSPSARKNSHTIFKGLATIFNSDVSKQLISVYLISSGEEKSQVVSELTISYLPVNTIIMGLTNTNQTKIFNG